MVDQVCPLECKKIFLDLKITAQCVCVRAHVRACVCVCVRERGRDMTLMAVMN